MATKSTRSSGTQFTPKGVTQGVTLIDPKSGDPVDTVVDTNGVKRLAVDGNFVAQNVQASVELDYNEDSVQIGDPITGATLKIEPDGSINANVEVDASDGDNIGIKAQERTLTPADNKYTKRVTAITGNENTDTTSFDVSLHDHYGNEFLEKNPLKVTTNYEKIIQLILNSNWLNTANYDSIQTTVSNDRSSITIQFLESSAVIGEAVVNYTSDLSWDFQLSRYVLDTDGSKLLDDDNTPLNLD